jgi:hypothetical protein
LLTRTPGVEERYSFAYIWTAVMANALETTPIDSLPRLRGVAENRGIRHGDERQLVQADLPGKLEPRRSRRSPLCRGGVRECLATDSNGFERPTAGVHRARRAPGIVRSAGAPPTTAPWIRRGSTSTPNGCGTPRPRPSRLELRSDRPGSRADTNAVLRRLHALDIPVQAPGAVGNCRDPNSRPRDVLTKQEVEPGPDRRGESALPNGHCHRCCRRRRARSSDVATSWRSAGKRSRTLWFGRREASAGFWRGGTRICRRAS